MQFLLKRIKSDTIFHILKPSSLKGKIWLKEIADCQRLTSISFDEAGTSALKASSIGR